MSSCIPLSFVAVASVFAATSESRRREVAASKDGDLALRGHVRSAEARLQANLDEGDGSVHR